MRMLTRYVLAELTKVFLISLTALTLLILVLVLVKEAADHSLPLAHVLRLIPYALPESLTVTIPVTLLLACTTVYSRMSGANEVVAAKALGISPIALLQPAFCLALLLSLATVWLDDLAVSWGRNGMKGVVVEGAVDIIYSLLRAKHSYTSPSFSISVHGVEGQKLLRPTVVMQGRGTTPTTTIAAEEAVLESSKAEGILKIFLRTGTIDVGGKMKMQFPDIYQLELPLAEASQAGSGDSAKPSWLPLRDVQVEIVKQRAYIEQCERKMAANAAYQMLCGDFASLAGLGWDSTYTGLEWSAIYAGHENEQTRLNRLLTEPPRRWAAGFSCLCFALVGAPIAIRLRNRDFLTSFFLCFVPILVVYYPLLMFGLHATKGGTMPPYSVWEGNVLLAIWGIWLLRKVVRY